VAWQPLVAVVLFIGGSLLLGLRLLRVGWTTGQLPELLMGIAFFTGGGIGATLQFLAQFPELLPPVFSGATLAFGRLCVHVGILCQASFTWVVFRPHSTAARALLAGLTLAFVAASIGTAAQGGIGDPAYSGFWFWLEGAAAVAAISWGALEALRWHVLMRRRLRYGLADPLVVNRFLLWGTALGAGVLASAVDPVIHALGVDATTTRPLIGVAAGLGTVAALGIALTFFPPAWYRARVRGAAVA